jgi:Predicted nucleotidyltransferases
MTSSKHSKRLPDLDSEHLAIVQDILQSHIPDLEVWIFGSRATGKAKNTSDLDIAIIANDPIDMMLLANIKDTFSESNLPFKVDIVDYGNVSPEFRKLITKEKLVLQK